MKFLLVSRIDNRDALAFIGTIRALLERKDATVVLDSDTARSLGQKGVLLGGAKADAVIVVGGDGTILRTVQQMNSANPPPRCQLGRSRVPRRSRSGGSPRVHQDAARWLFC